MTASNVPHAPRKLKVATVSLAGCFGCHMSLLDIDERLLALVEKVEFDRSPLTDIKHCGKCDIGIIEGGVCNAENVHVLREFRANCKILVAMGACAVTGGLLTLGMVFASSGADGAAIGGDPHQPMPFQGQAVDAGIGGIE